MKLKKAEKGESEETKKLDWLHRPKRELNDLIEKIKDDTDLNNEAHTKII